MANRTLHPATGHQPRVTEWRALLGPGHQFPTLNDRILTYWSTSRPR